LRYPQGSTWGKWDLHVHTPASLVQFYGGANKEVWERFFRDIESLPAEFKVLGINDYLFVDGYRRVLQAKRRGRLSNIDLLLPVVEFRLDKFGGSESRLSRVNFHVIFSDEIDPDTIDHHLLNTLSNSFRLEPEHEGLARRWSSNITRQSLEELGTLIIETTPQDKRTGSLSPLHKGFSNLTFKLEDIRDRLAFHHFEGKYLTAVGKTEWADIKWNYQTAADKKDVINDADVVFISSETPEDWKRAKDHLRESGVNHRLLDCSDAHYFSDVVRQKDRLGNCHTWIKAAPTFEGLEHALEEPEERIFVGEEPEKVTLVRQNRTKYIESLRISKVPGSPLDEVWFDDELEFNTDLVAVIGNKGSGKSALVDVLGLMGDTRQYRAFSFLNNKKFRRPKDKKAEHFEATVTLKSGKSVTKRLSDPVNEHEVEAVKYIPQSFLETICNEVASGEGEHFRAELEAVIFSHVGEADRLETSSLEELIQYKTQETYDAIEALKEELRAINTETIRLEEHSTEEYRKSLERHLTSKQEELSAHDEARPTEVPKPGSNPEAWQLTAAVSEELDDLKLERNLVTELIAGEEVQQMELARLTSAIEKAMSKAENIQHRYLTSEAELSEGLRNLGIAPTDVVELKVDLSPLQQAKKLYYLLENRTDELLDPLNSTGYNARLRAVEEKIAALQGQLDEPNRTYEKYLAALSDWKTKRKEITGSRTAVGSIRYLEARLQELEEVPEMLNGARRRRREKAAEIHHEIKKLAGTYRDLYAPVQKFIEEHHLAKGMFDLNFEVAIAEENFETRFFAQINRNRGGSFCGISESSTLINSILEQHDFRDEIGTLMFLDQIVEHLQYDTRTETRRRTQVPEQLKQGYTAQSLYDFLFSLDYLKPRYTLRMGDKDLDQLSPGERGTLLLIFYLLIDKDDVPLIIDQPEENLDNQTIYNLLVPCIREAKKRRQLFLVTHNPNLAVAGDAEQIIRASIDKRDSNRITYASGPLEDFDINEMAVNILEGTRPAFENRRSKYRVNPAL
jgi:ABC-type lipoprotein export system ATPase subunit